MSENNGDIAVWSEANRGGDGWAPGGSYVIPLFEWNKTPSYEAWQRGESTAWASVKTWMEKRREQTGRLPTVTGRFVVMNGWGVVIDCEGRKWAGSRDPLPSWLEAVLGVARSGALASWVSSGGDGGKDVRNILIPYPVDAVALALGLPTHDTAAGGIAGAAFRRQSIMLGSEMKAELLLRSGVCVPASEVIPESGDNAGTKCLVQWRGDWMGASVQSLQELARPIMSDLLDVLRGAILSAAESASASGDFVAGAGSDGAPLVKELEVVLWRDGPEAGLLMTQEMLDAGASRHYMAKTWANWALLSRGEALKERGGSNEGALRIVGEKIFGDWAEASGFTWRETMKSVVEEARFLKWV